MISNMNKNLDFNRRVKTYISKLEDNKSKNRELDLVLDNQRERRISEITHYFSNTLNYNILNKDGKANEDEDMIRKTGYFANPDDDSYQSNPGVMHKTNFGSEILEKHLKNEKRVRILSTYFCLGLELY